jgi:hypothetical protein
MSPWVVGVVVVVVVVSRLAWLRDVLKRHR